MKNSSDHCKIKIAIHLHLYRMEQFSQIRKYLDAILAAPNTDSLLFITIAYSSSQDVIDRIIKYYPDAIIKKVENRGYDVYPFLVFIDSIDLAEYDYVVKLHTKDVSFGISAKIGKYRMTRSLWSKLLFQAIAKNAASFVHNLEHFQENPKLGMIGSYYLIAANNEDSSAQPYANVVAKELAAVSLNTSLINYVCGTIFMARAGLLAIFKKQSQRLNFEEAKCGCKNGTLAHIYERVLGSSIIAQGYELQGFDKSLIKDLLTSHWYNSILKFLFSKRKTSNGRLLIRILGIPVYNQKLRKE